MTARVYQMAVTLEIGAGYHLDVEIRLTLVEDQASFAAVDVYGPFDNILDDKQLARVRRRAARWLGSDQGQQFALEHVALREQVGADFASQIEQEAFIR